MISTWKIRWGGYAIEQHPRCYLPGYEQGVERPILANDQGGANDAETYGASASAAFVDG